jgi:hypothetical protein
MPIRVNNFPLCCGGAVLTDFANTPTSGARNGKVPVKQLEEELEDALKACKYKSIVVATLNEDQKKVFGPSMLKYGFRPVHVEYYSGHGREITLYVRRTPENKKKRRAKSGLRHTFWEVLTR